MNLDKLSIMLCMAFQESDGPFDIVIKFEGGEEEALLSKEEIKVLSMQELVISIDISRRLNERRWRERLINNDKRNK